MEGNYRDNAMKSTSHNQLALNLDHTLNGIDGCFLMCLLGIKYTQWLAEISTGVLFKPLLSC